MSGYLIKRGKTFYVRFEINGQDKRRSLRTGNRAEAEKRLVAWRKQISHISFYGEERRTWPTAVTKYAKEVLPQSVKPKTAQRYLVSLRQLDSPFPCQKTKGLWRCRGVPDIVPAAPTDKSIARGLPPFVL